MATTAPPKPVADSAPDHWKPELHDIPTDAITTAANVRSDLGDITELADSIEQHGFEQPVRVVELGPRDGAPAYELVFGHRRLAAARHLGLRSIPALVEPFASDGRNGVAGRTVRQLIENLQRAELNALDTAKAYRALLDAGLTQRELAAQLGISQPTIANTLAILKQPEAIQERVASGELTRSHVEVLAKLPAAERAEVARRVVEHGLSTRQVEEEIDRAARRQSEEDARRDKLRNRNQELLAGWIAQLLKKRADPATTTLVGWAGTPADGLAALAERGWERSQTASRGADQAWLSPAPKGFCDCDAYELTYRIDWRAGGETYHPKIVPACVVKEHQVAADKAAAEARAKEQAEYAAQRQAEVEARAETVAPIVERLAADNEMRARVVLWSLLDNAWGGSATAFFEEVGRSWQEIAPLPLPEVERWTIAILADDVVDAPDVREALAAPPASDRPPKPPKPPKDREQG